MNEIAIGTKVRIIGTYPRVTGTVVAMPTYAGQVLYHVDIPGRGNYLYGPELLKPVR